MSERATVWSLTINNPSTDDEECIARARQMGWKVDGQIEKGEQGTRHYQLMLKTPQVRFSAVKKAFPRAHIEVAKNVVALKQYVHKEETREGELSVKQDMYPSQSKFFDLVWDIILADETEKSEYIRGKNGRFASPRNAMVAATKDLIRQGYIVENIACNPMTIQAWLLFHDDFLARKTLRQTDNALNIQETNVPMIPNAPNEKVSPSHDSSSSSHDPPYAPAAKAYAVVT